MSYIIFIVFTAELIILYTLVKVMIDADNAVCNLTKCIDKRRTLLKWRCLAIKDISQGVNDVFPVLLKKVNIRKRELIIKYLNELIQFFVLIFFKPKYKKILVGTRTGISIAKKILKV